MKSKFLQVIRNNKRFLVFIILMSIFRSAVADWNSVPTGSMKPTIIEGDRIFVNKVAYDIRVPFTHISLIRHSDPARGDIIVFDSKKSELRLVKRVIGLPGDIVEMENNVLKINGEVLQYTHYGESRDSKDKIENLLGIKHFVRTKQGNSGRLSTFSPVRVPTGHYLVLGDNRDNSADSRIIGFVPRNEIVGRSRSIVMSLDYENFYLPRSNRYFRSIN